MSSKVRADVEERRQKVYELHIMCWSTVQIAKAPGIDDSNVSNPTVRIPPGPPT